MFRAWILAGLVLLSLPAMAPAQGLLERIRHGSVSSSSGSLSSLNNQSSSSQDGLDDEGYGELVGLGLIAVTSPLWLPPLVVGDDYQQTASFSPYPYARFDSAYLNLLAAGSEGNPDASFNDPDYLKCWSALLQIEDGNDFNGLNRVGVRAAFDTSLRLGVRSNWDYYEESLGNGRSDHTLIGDTELTFRFAQTDWLRLYAGAGFRAMEDSQTDRWGFNFTYGGDAFPVWPLVLSASIDLGDLGDAFVVDARASAGWAWRNAELFIGYDFRRIGTVNLQGMLGGFRIWF